MNRAIANGELKLTKKTKALDRQIGGTHYKDQGIQPLEITFRNFGYHGLRGAILTKVNKYLTREKGDHIENLEKAAHCIEMQIEFAKQAAKSKGKR